MIIRDRWLRRRKRIPRYDHGLKHGDIIQGPYFPQVKQNLSRGKQFRQNLSRDKQFRQNLATDKQFRQHLFIATATNLLSSTGELE